ncbi:MAG: isoleucine--tRNA ligase [Spirochaetia bacterium]|nr:isoleucine--tRNA ligase [Spirochaetia bacterium]
MSSDKKQYSEKNKWSQTIMLPETKFPMRAELAKREPEIIEYWQSEKIYERILNKRKENNSEKYILHDGPPYANGNFHVGHALNKILKDLINKYKIITGHYAPYVPGWDCHGLPIELAVMKKLSNKKDGSDKDPIAIRKACREYALSFMKVQAQDQTRFGVFWNEEGMHDLSADNQKEHENFYYTMSNQYEAAILKVFRDIFEKKLIYKGEKPIHWCPSCATALAEAEVEYADHVSPSIYVKFPVKNKENTFVVIWTTTPWTLPANLALSFHPEYKYCEYETNSGNLILAEGLEERFFKETNLEFSKKTAIEKNEIENFETRHPFIERESKILFGDHVTLEAGTGVVHTAPGHGQEDYQIGLKYDLKPYSPVDHRGRFTDDFEPMKGQKVFQSNEKIMALLKEKEMLIASKEIEHSYPHCWRCRGPLIFRATPQWFMAVESLKKKTLENSAKVNWIPKWGQERFESMIENRPDWCLSRQRHWGVPIPAFSCEDCGESNLTIESLNHIISLVEKEGIEIWFQKDVKELIPSGLKCSNCSGQNFTKERDILDVWFDSGISWYSVLSANESLEYPCDLYLEGSDQHRGWFQSSIWPSIALNQIAPYKTVLTHGYVLDENGKAMSKSLGNGFFPAEEIIPKYGADVLRLWVSSEDYKTDNRISFDMIERLSDSYRKIRNTFRYILGNLKDGEASKGLTDKDVTDTIDLWVLNELFELGLKVKKSYESYEFHQVYHRILQFCTVTLSNVYFDIIRDRLYCNEAPEAKGAGQENIEKRKSSLRALQMILDHLIVWLSPVLSFTTEEIQRIYNSSESVFEKLWPDAVKWENAKLKETMQPIWALKEEVNIKLEQARKDQIIGSSIEASVIVPREKAERLNEKLVSLLDFFLVVSEVTIEDVKEIVVKSSSKEKCPRCWLRKDLTESGVCGRCNDVLGL